MKTINACIDYRIVVVFPASIRSQKAEGFALVNGKGDVKNPLAAVILCQALNSDDPQIICRLLLRCIPYLLILLYYIRISIKP